MSMDAVVKTVQAGGQSIDDLSRKVERARAELAKYQEQLAQVEQHGASFGRGGDRGAETGQVAAALRQTLWAKAREVQGLEDALLQQRVGAGQTGATWGGVRVPIAPTPGPPGRPGPEIIYPPEPRRRGAEGGGRGADVPPPRRGADRGSDGSADDGGDGPRDTEEATRVVDRHTQAIDRARLSRSAMAYSEQRLRAEWRQTNTDIRGLDREIDNLTKRQERWRDSTRRGREEEVLKLQGEIADRRQGMRAFTEYQNVLRHEVQRRGGTTVGNQLLFEGAQRPGRGAAVGFQQAAGAFLGGMGVGGGSIGGTIAGAAVGALNPALAIAALGGLIVGRGVQYLQEAYTTQMQMLQRALPLARATGTSGYDLIEAAKQHSERYKIFDVSDLLGATSGLGRATGRTELTSILPVAALTGQTASEEAQRIGALSRYGTGHNPYLSGDIFRAFLGSPLARPRPLPPGIQGPQLPYETLLYPEFAGGVGKLAQGFGSPFTRVSLESTAGMLEGATWHLGMPGIDPLEIGGLDVAANKLLGSAQLISGSQGGALGQLQMLAMMELRKNPGVVEKLREQDIDINTYAGMKRAIPRAFELAGKNVPEVLQSILGMYGRYTSPGLLETMLGGGEAAHEVATNPQGILAAATSRRRRSGAAPAEGEPWSDEFLDTLARTMSGNVGGVDAYYQQYIRPQNLALDLATKLAGPIGEALAKGMNDIRTEVQQTLFNFLNSETSHGPNTAAASMMSHLPINPAVVGGSGYFQP